MKKSSAYIVLGLFLMTVFPGLIYLLNKYVLVFGNYIIRLIQTIVPIGLIAAGAVCVIIGLVKMFKEAK